MDTNVLRHVEQTLQDDKLVSDSQSVDESSKQRCTQHSHMPLLIQEWTSLSVVRIR